MDPTRFFSGQTANDGSAAPANTSDATGSTAPSDASQVSSGVPEQAQHPPQAGQPQGQQAQVDPSGQPQETPTPDPTAERLAQLERENQQFRGTFSQFQHALAQQATQAQRQQAQQQFEQRITDAQATANTMSPADGLEYMARQQKAIVSDLFGVVDRAGQQFEQEKRQLEYTLGTPLYVKHLIQEAGLPAETEKRLMALGNPDLIRAQIPYFKQEHERNQELTNRLDQLSRSMQAGQMVQNGAGAVGGSIAPPSIQIPEDADPDTKAMAIYADIMQRAGRR